MYSIAKSFVLLLALLVEPSRAGSWCGVIGVPHVGVEAAARLGVELRRLVLIPEPGQRWMAVLAAVAEVLPVVMRPPGSATEAQASRLAARLRERGTVLLVQGPWPGAEAVVDITRPTWSGLGNGYGYLADRELIVQIANRHGGQPRRADVVLPTADGGIVDGYPVGSPGRSDADIEGFGTDESRSGCGRWFDEQGAPDGSTVTRAWCCGFRIGR